MPKLFLNTLTITLVFSSPYFANPSFGFDLGGALQSLGEGISKAGKELEKELQNIDKNQKNQNCREVIDDFGDSEMICEPKEKQKGLEEPQQQIQSQQQNNTKDFRSQTQTPANDQSRLNQRNKKTTSIFRFWIVHIIIREMF